MVSNHVRYRSTKVAAIALVLVAMLAGLGVARAGLAEPSGGARPPLGLEQAKTLCRQHSALVGMAVARVDAARLEADEAELSAGAIPDALVASYETASMKILQPAKAETDLALAEAALEALYANLDLQVTQAYSGAVSAERFLELAETSVARAEDQVRLAQKLHTAGMVARKDVLDAEAKLAEAMSGLISARKGNDLARAALLRLTGMSYQDTPLLDPGAIDGLPEPAELTQAVALALQRRYEAAQSREYRELAELNLDLADAYPSGSYSSLLIDLLPPGIDIPPEWLEPSWETSRRYTIPKAEAQLAEAECAEQAQREEIEFQVRSAYLDLDEASRKVDLLEPAVAAAREGLRLARLRYEAGMSTNLEVMAAELALSVAETNHQQAVFSRQMATAKLLHSYGYGSKAVYPAANQGL